MKYMLMMNCPHDGYQQFLSWPKQLLDAHITFMRTFARKLSATGELVGAEGLASPLDAKRVRADNNGTPITDGVLPESKEFLAGFWIVQVTSPERAYQIAAEASTGSRQGRWGALNRGPGGRERTADIARMTLDADALHLLRELTPQVLGAVCRQFPDFAASEDAVQEALLAAAVQWPAAGVPVNPRGWLIHVACRRMSDHLRSESARARREAESLRLVPDDERLMPAASGVDSPGQDDTLLLLFMCCHPALTTSSAIALTLRAVGGLTTAEIANAFLVPEATMAQRISRAKQRIRDSGIRFAVPNEHEWRHRLGSVMHVLYLIFSEGYASSIGPDLQRRRFGSRVRCAGSCPKTASSPGFSR